MFVHPLRKVRSVSRGKKEQRDELRTASERPARDEERDEAAREERWSRALRNNSEASRRRGRQLDTREKEGD